MLIPSTATESLNSELQNKTGYNKTCNLKITLKENPLPGCLDGSERHATLDLGVLSSSPTCAIEIT